MKKWVMVSCSRESRGGTRCQEEEGSLGLDSSSRGRGARPWWLPQTLFLEKESALEHLAFLFPICSSLRSAVELWAMAFSLNLWPSCVDVPSSSFPPRNLKVHTCFPGPRDKHFCCLRSGTRYSKIQNSLFLLFVIYLGFTEILYYFILNDKIYLKGHQQKWPGLWCCFVSSGLVTVTGQKLCHVCRTALVPSNSFGLNICT